MPCPAFSTEYCSFQNQMRDAMKVWEVLCHSPWFDWRHMVSPSHSKSARPHAVFALTGACFRCQILILNKNDLFESKIQTSHIVDFFPASVTLPQSHDGACTDELYCLGL